MADDGFQLPRSPYEEVRTIIVAYGHLNEPGSLEDVAGYGGMSATTVSRNNGFLLSMGVLEPGKKKGLSKPGKRLADAIEHGIHEEVARRWREIIAESDFLQKVLAAVKIRKGMERSALESHIAYTAGEKKTPRVMTGAGTVVDILMDAGLLDQENGKLIAAQDLPNVDLKREEELPRPEQFAEEPPSRLHEEVRIGENTGGLRINLNIDVTVSCNPEDIDELGARLRRLLDELHSGTPSSTMNETKDE